MIKFRIQSTPNPNARKYVTDQNFKDDGKVSYKKPEECEHVPIADALFKIPGVVQVHFFENVVTITQDGTYDWANMDQWIQDTVIHWMNYHDPSFEEFIKQDKPKKKLSAELEKIDKVIDETIRPSLQMDGGDVELISLEDHVLTISYMGACGGCPSSMSGTLHAIQSVIKDEVDEKIEVVAI